MQEVKEQEPVPWTRTDEGRVVAGVCAAFARRYGVSPWKVRLLALLAMVVTAGLAVIAYVILAVLIPLDRPRRPGGA
jgi:phage shock protein PspC (stress-responsive transcriptional regulator)